MSFVSNANQNVEDLGVYPVKPGSAALRRVIEEIGAAASAAKKAGSSLHPVIDLVRTSRLGAFRIPLVDGGGGATVREYFAMLIDLAEADADVAHILRAHYWFVEERLRAADGALRTRWISRAAAGEIFGNAVMEMGSSAAVGSWVLQTHLVPTASGYTLTGRKYYCTGSMYSDWVMVMASTADGKLASAVVPTTRKGVSLEDDWDGIGQRLTGSGTGIFDDVAVEPDEILMAGVESTEAASLENPTEPYLVGQFCQLILTAIIAGVMRNVVSDAVRLVRKRGRTYTHASAETAAADPILQQVIGQIASHAFAAEAMVLAAADAQDAALATVVNGLADFDLAHRASLLTAQAKVVIDELAPRAATMLFDVGGSSAVKQSENLDCHWRNIRTLSSHNPTPYKARALGSFLVNGERLPTNGFF